MLVGCNTLSFAAGSDEESLRILASAGFDSVDYNLNKYGVRDPISPFWQLCEADCVKHATDLASVANEIGITVGQVHSPYPTFFPTEEKVKQVLGFQRRSLKIASLLSAPYVVIHPNVPPSAKTPLEVEEAVENNLAYYSKLFEDIKRCGVQVGIENMYNWDWDVDVPLPTVASTAECMAYMVDSLNNMCGDKLFVACLDTGHAVLTGGGSPARMVDILGSRLKLLHIHDNDGKRDRHYPPFSGVIDWDEFAKSLVANNYRGVLSLEVKADGSEAKSVYETANKLKTLVEKEM